MIKCMWAVDIFGIKCKYVQILILVTVVSDVLRFICLTIF